MASVRMSRTQAKAIERASRKERKPKSEWIRGGSCERGGKLLDATGFEPASPGVE